MSDGQSIRFGDVVHIISRNQKAGTRHIFHDKRRIPRNMLSDVPGNRARIGVVTATRRGTDDNPDGLALVEGVLCVYRVCEQKQNQRYGSDQTSKNFAHNTSFKTMANCIRVSVSISLKRYSLGVCQSAINYKSRQA